MSGVETPTRSKRIAILCKLLIAAALVTWVGFEEDRVPTGEATTRESGRTSQQLTAAAIARDLELEHERALLEQAHDALLHGDTQRAAHLLAQHKRHVPAGLRP